MGRQRLVQHGTDICGDHLQVLLCLGHRQHIGKLCQSYGCQLPLQGKHLLQPAQRRIIAPCQRLIDLHHRLIGIHGIYGDKYIHLTSGDRLLHQRLHGVFRENIRSGHLHSAVQIAVINRSHLHSNITPVAFLPCPAISGHALDHFLTPPLYRQQQ